MNLPELQRSAVLMPDVGLSRSEHDATIRLELEERGEETELRMECRGVPAGEEDSTKEGWMRTYFQAIRNTFGY